MASANDTLPSAIGSALSVINNSERDEDESLSGYSVNSFNAQSNDDTFDGFSPSHGRSSDNDVANFDDFDDDDPLSAGSDIDVSSVDYSSSDDEVSDNEDNLNGGQLREYQPDWTTTNFSAETVLPFEKESGPCLPDDFDIHVATPLDYFQLFFTDFLFDKVVEYTNGYSNWLQVPWVKKTDLDEIKCFTGLNIMFGLIPLHCYKTYWNSDIFLGNAGIKLVMPRNRYEQLNRFLHVSDRSVEPPIGSANYDKIYKVRDVMDYVQKKFVKYSNPSCAQSVDEGMISYKGRVSYLQYMPAKPIKRGLKLFIRADADTGYLNDFELYLGKHYDNASPLGSYFHVVERLTRSILNRRHKIYFDNAYTSIPLAVHLLQNGTYCCGTVRSNRRGLPAAIKSDANLARGEFRCAQDKKLPNLTATVWRDTKVVRFLSTSNDPSKETRTLRRINGVRTEVTQPTCAAEYSLWMKGVDVFDHLRGVFSVGRRSKKAWKYIWYFLINSAVVNAWLIYKKVSLRNVKMTHTKFRHELALGLMRKHKENTRAPSHKHVHLGLKRGRCCVAHKRFKPNGKARFETKYGCKGCNVVLCTYCHPLYHRLL
jgi:hypothetical protein